MIRQFANGTIEWIVDRARGVVLSRWEGDVGGDELLAASPALWRERPEIGSFAAVHDLIDFTGVIEHRYGRELMRLRTEFFGHDLSATRTAIVSLDPMKLFEVKVAEIQAPQRLFRVFGRNADALAWVTADEPGNPSALRKPVEGALPWWFGRPAPVADRAG